MQPARPLPSAPKNRDLSFLVSGAGPRVFVPILAISRPASAFTDIRLRPMFAGRGDTRAPFLRQRDASGVST
jgi:hypothetical protein